MEGKNLIILLTCLCLVITSCGESSDSEQEDFDAQDVVSWDLDGENFNKSGQWTYCDTEDFSGNFAIYGTNSIEGEGVVISIDDNSAPVSEGQIYTFDKNSISQLIYIDKNSNRWSSLVEDGTGLVEISIFYNKNGVSVEGKFSGTLFSKDDGSDRIIEDGFFSVRCF